MKKITKNSKLLLQNVFIISPEIFFLQAADRKKAKGKGRGKGKTKLGQMARNLKKGRGKGRGKSRGMADMSENSAVRRRLSFGVAADGQEVPTETGVSDAPAADAPMAPNTPEAPMIEVGPQVDEVAANVADNGPVAAAPPELEDAVPAPEPHDANRDHPPAVAGGEGAPALRGPTVHRTPDRLFLICPPGCSVLLDSSLAFSSETPDLNYNTRKHQKTPDIYIAFNKRYLIPKY